MNKRRHRVVCVEEDPRSLDGFREHLEAEGYELTRVEAPEVGRRVLASGAELILAQGGGSKGVWERVITDLGAGDEGASFVPTLFIDRADDPANQARGLALGAQACLSASSPPALVQAQIEALLRTRARILEAERARQELQRMATVDPLTGLLNRRQLRARVREEFIRARRYSDSIALLMVDLDDFSQINHLHGDEAGTRVLAAAAGRLREATREVDLAGREGGDTFAVLLPNTHLNGALAVAERIARALTEKPFQVGAEQLRLTASQGLAFFPAPGVGTADDLMVCAKEGLYRAKQEGKDRICLFQAAQYLYTQQEAQKNDG